LACIGTDTMNYTKNITFATLNLPLKYICKLQYPQQTGTTYTSHNFQQNVPGSTATITKFGNVGELVEGTFKLKLVEEMIVPDTLFVTGHFSLIRK